jgi:arabinoxylan arabinofuranohydrolase
LGYATADSPLGPFTYRGILIDNDGCDPESWNNHGSIEEFNGQWYVFYHRCSRGTQLHRRLCCEKIDILPDGTIPEVVMTSQGAGGPFLPGEKIPGFRACGVSGQCFIGGEPDERLMHIAGGDTAVFRYVKSAAGFHDVKITASGSGHITFLMNGQEIGSAEVRHGRTVKRVVNGVAGTYELTLRFDSSENLEIRDLTFEDHR